MVEEKKDENVEALLEKSIELVEQGKPPTMPPHPLPPLPRLLEPTCSLIQNKPTRSYHRKNKHNIPDITPETKPYVGSYAHTRECTSCSNELHWQSLYPRNTAGSDHEARTLAEAEGWTVRLLISGHFLFTCSTCG